VLLSAARRVGGCKVRAQQALERAERGKISATGARQFVSGYSGVAELILCEKQLLQAGICDDPGPDDHPDGSEAETDAAIECRPFVESKAKAKRRTLGREVIIQTAGAALWRRYSVSSSLLGMMDRYDEVAASLQAQATAGDRSDENGDEL
jgi:hypothetical protein